MTQVSGFILSSEFEVSETFTEISELSSSGFNVLLQAKRNGQWWILKSLKPDVLVDLTLSDYLPVAYLVASSNAPMRLGLKKDSLAPADIMVQLESEQATAEGLLRNLLFYWKNIAVQ